MRDFNLFMAKNTTTASAVRKGQQARGEAIEDETVKILDMKKVKIKCILQKNGRTLRD